MLDGLSTGVSRWQIINYVGKSITKEFMIITIRINYEFEGGKEKSVTRMTDWHEEACQVMANSDHEG